MMLYIAHHHHRHGSNLFLVEGDDDDEALKNAKDELYHHFDEERDDEYVEVSHCEDPLYDNAMNLRDTLSLLLDRLAEHGSIDHVREEGPIQDAKDLLDKVRRLRWFTVIGALTTGHDNPEGFLRHIKAANEEEAQKQVEEHYEEYQPHTLFVLQGRIQNETGTPGEKQTHHPDCPAVDGFPCHCDGKNLEERHVSSRGD